MKIPFFNKNKNKKIDEKIEYKIISIIITMYDNKIISYERKYAKNSNISYKKAFYSFYKWFYMRENSEKFEFKYSTGSMMFYKKDIKRIEFKEEINRR